MERIVKAEKTRNGFWGFWEQGGSTKSEACSQIVTKFNGDKGKAVYRQFEQNGKHALIVVHVGYFLINVVKKANDCLIDIFRIDDISPDGDVKLVRKNYCINGKWETFVHSKFKEPIHAALQKAQCSECTHIFYANEAFGRKY